MKPDKQAELKVLFRSLKVGSLTLPNRIVMAPMTRGRSPGGVPGPSVAAYYRRRALGGVGLIISEGTRPGHASALGYPDVPVLDGDEPLAGWRRVVQGVHSAGGRIAAQIWHVGSYCRPGFDRGGTIDRLAPYPVTHPGMTGQSTARLPRRMEKRDIEAVVRSYGEAALNANRLGFDAVEIHGAHGYLIDQFFWSMTNKRLDEYGGAIKDRSRFAVEIIKEIKHTAGDAMPIIFRFSNWKLNVYDERGKLFDSPKELEAFLKPLADAGVDIFHASTRRFDTPEFAGSNLNLAGWTKRIFKKPTISVGSVGLTADFISERQGQAVTACSIERLLDRMDRGEFDLIAVGRALLADPFWLEKMRNGECEKIVPYTQESLGRLY